MKGTVGAGIVSVITESLYDKPIVVFREYIQNAADAMAQVKNNTESLAAHIWLKDNNLFFLDNATGIPSDKFESIMVQIANSQKTKKENIGYKGIGRLSGLSYCENLVFINIVDFSNNVFQEYKINGEKYNDIRKSEDFNEMSFEDLMKNIGTHTTTPNIENIKLLIKDYTSIFNSRNTGFLVVLENVSFVLNNVIKESDFIEKLNWLLPVPFKENLQSPNLFNALSQERAFTNDSAIPARSYRIYYNNTQLKRPLDNQMIRTYLCKSNLAEYAVCIHTFSNKKIAIDKTNPFSGIRIYIDNMLLCDENELIPALEQHGLTKHKAYELIQSVKGIGALIYIVDKINISANARRTFIDITDKDSVDFLTLLGDFVENIYSARYALSNYYSAKSKVDYNKEKLADLQEKALHSLKILASNDISLENDSNTPQDFYSLSKTEQKSVIKTKVAKEFNSALKKYLSQTDNFDPDTCFNDFIVWLGATHT